MYKCIQRDLPSSEVLMVRTGEKGPVPFIVFAAISKLYTLYGRKPIAVYDKEGEVTEVRDDISVACCSTRMW